MAPVLFHCLQWTSSSKSLGFNLRARILAIAGRGVVGCEEIFYWKNKSSKQRGKYVSLPFPQPHCEYSFVEAAGQGQRSQIHSGGVISKYYALTKVLLAILLQSPIAISCLKNRNTVGESPNNIRKVLRWESDISIGGGCRRADDQWRYLDMVTISFVLCFVMLCVTESWQRDDVQAWHIFF